MSALGLGCWQFSDGAGLVGGFWRALDQKTVHGIVEISLRNGINWVDTAEAYGKGASERILARVLKDLPPDLKPPLIATKWWPVLRTAASIEHTIEDRLSNLNGFPIMLHQIHNPFSLSTVTAQIDRMRQLLEAGKIGSIGVSNFSVKKMLLCQRHLLQAGHCLASNQVKYSLLDRRKEFDGGFSAARDEGITIFAYSPLEQGLLTGKFHRHPDLVASRPGPRKLLSGFRPAGLKRTAPLITLLERIAEKHKATAAQVALHWTVRYHGNAVAAIPGASSLRQARENAGALNLQLSQAELDEIHSLSLQVART